MGCATLQGERFARTGSQVKIYKEQLDALTEIRAVAFEKRLVRFLRDNVAAGGEGEAVASEVRARIVEAREAGLDTERQIAKASNDTLPPLRVERSSDAPRKIVRCFRAFD
jgi:hypothetical protein